jgi:oligopeptide transport system permease protein
MSSDKEQAKYEHLLEAAESIKGVSLGKDAWRRLKRNRAAMIALRTLTTVCLLAFFTPLLPLQAPKRIDTDRVFQSPSITTPGFIEIEPKKVDAHFGDQSMINELMIKTRIALFGTWAVPSICGRDELGRDLLARLFWGARISLIVGFVATLVSLVIGVSYGAIAGYLGGWVDNLMMRIVDVLYSIPFIFVVIFLLTILGEPSVAGRLEDWGIDRITIFFFVVGAIYWLTMARVVRGQVISLKNDQFVEAARAIGASRARIIFLHLVPNLLSIVIVYLTLTIPRVILFETFLSFLGLGVEAPDVSWGLLANAGFKVITPVKIFWWLIIFPAVALGVTLFSLNFLGDGLRDALDPRLKNRT